jgi:transposase
MRAYSPDLRAKILAAVDRGMNKAQAARIFGVDDETIRRYVIQRRETGTLDPRPHPGRSPLIRPEQREVLWAQLVEHPEATLIQHCTLWEARTGLRIAVPTMSREIRRLGWTRKKDRWVPPSGTKGSAEPGIGS